MDTSEALRGTIVKVNRSVEAVVTPFKAPRLYSGVSMHKGHGRETKGSRSRLESLENITDN